MRPFFFRQISLATYRQLDPTSPTITSEIETLFDNIMTDILGSLSNDSMLPLVRLSVDVTGFPSIPIQIYGAKYVGKIANPNSLLNLRRKRVTNGSALRSENDECAPEVVGGKAQFDTMISMIENSVAEAGGLQVLNERHMREACRYDVKVSYSVSIC